MNGTDKIGLTGLYGYVLSYNNHVERPFGYIYWEINGKPAPADLHLHGIMWTLTASTVATLWNSKLELAWTSMGNRQLSLAPTFLFPRRTRRT